MLSKFKLKKDSTAFYTILRKPKKKILQIKSKLLNLNCLNFKDVSSS